MNIQRGETESRVTKGWYFRAQGVVMGRAGGRLLWSDQNVTRKFTTDS